jgi:hypothetical protein
MMKKNYSTVDRSEFRKLVFFLFLGVLLSVIPVLLVPYFVIVNFYYLRDYAITRKVNSILILFFFLPAFELERRILGVGVLPYEIGKYTSILYYFILLTANLRSNKASESSFFVLLLLVFPSIFMMDIVNFQNKITFSFLGILNLGLLGLLFSRLTISTENIKEIFKGFVLSSIPVVTIISIRTPNFDEIDFALGANFDTAGGFGPNQVSTFLGAVAFVIILYQLVYKSKIFNRFKYLDFIILFGISIRLLLTFSRGGVLAPIGALLLPINILAKFQKIESFFKNFIAVALFSTLPFLLVNNLTEGALLLRFSGETRKTIDGNAEKDIESISSGRSSIVENDLEIWSENIFFGVGPGESPKYRGGGLFASTQTHTEYSRLLSEHGILGLFINFILIIYIPLKIYFSKISSQIKYIKLSFIIISVLSMTHSAMRTVVPFLFYAFGAVNIVEQKKT